MKSFFKLTLLFVGVAFLFTSCSKKNEEGKMIPKNAMFVVQLNTKSLKEKLTWNDIKNSNWYNMALEQSQDKAMSNPEIKKILDNPENSGIDLNSSLVFFVGKNPGTEGEAVLEGSIKNADNFAQFNKSFDSSATVSKDGDLNILKLHDKAVVAWNDKHFVYAFDASNASSRFNPMNNNTGNQTNVAPLVDKSVGLAATCKNLFSLKSDSSLAENEKFTKLLKEKGDIHAWVNSEEIMKSSSSLGMLGMLKLDVFFKDNIGTYSVNFDNGKIDINHKGYAGKEFSDFLKKYSGGSINTDMIKNIPSQNVLGVLAINYKPEAIKELIKLMGMDGFLNMYSSQMGFNLDDFVKANKGDLTLAVSDLSIKNGSTINNQAAADSTTPSFTKPDFNVLFSVSIGDKTSFQKLLDAGKKIGGEMGRNDTSIAYGQNDKVFAITNHQHFLNDYLAGNANNKYDFIDKLSGHSVGLYIDIHKILSVMANEKINDADKKLLMDESLKLWNNVYVTTGDFKDNALTGHTEINFIDQSTNSLKQLNHYFDAIAKVEKEKKDKEKSEMKMTDSLIIPPPIDTVGHK
ncbi:DUF4836 family protein [Ginsengibacter hankyongi]|uniref:DUF4836 family protein n=1 Tax=Ginsengibacter hankyongi TaxID=2607284 RepID=A0A5J5IG18_9BACT|nr:DUF4836 family protein [Ginsengibacter hankyongi]KAA9039144.1 DUF4836 family protein [Ginsengibacter hankyongi]